MPEKNFTQETLAKIRSGQSSDNSKKKRSISRIILLVDAIIVVALLAYFYNRDTPTLSYKESNFTYKNINLRYSISRIQTEYIFSLTMFSEAPQPVTLQLNNNIATLKIKYEDNTILEKKMQEMKSITIIPKEKKTIVLNIDARELQKTLKNRIAIPKPRKTLFNFGNKTIPLKTNLTINAESSFTLYLDFNHEVLNE